MIYVVDSGVSGRDNLRWLGSAGHYIAGAELGQIRQGHLRSDDGEFTQTSELTGRQRELLGHLGIPEPPRFGRISAATPAQALAQLAQPAQRPQSRCSDGSPAAHAPTTRGTRA